MKLSKQLRSTLIAVLLENNASHQKALAGKTPEKADDKRLNEWGLTEAQMELAARFARQIGLGDATAYALAVSGRVDIDPEKIYHAISERNNLSSGSRNTARLTFPALTAVVVEKNNTGARHIPAIHNTVIVTHQIKGFYLQSNGVEEYTLTDNPKTGVSTPDKLRLATKDEIEVMLDTLSDAQVRTIIAHKYFESVRERLLIAA